jgi:CheY-like chemotaxis protein
MWKVLLIEDSKLLRIANERLLSKAGYGVISAEDGEAALRKVHVDKEQPDVILLDMMLPKVDGQDVLKALKKDPATAGIPVIVVTSLSKRNEFKLLRDGAAAFLEKSVLFDDPQSLLNAIETLARHGPHTA